jgi:hypothetical protein
MARSSKTSASPVDNARNMPWGEAIRTVLTAADGGLPYTEIAERIVSSGLRRDVGATPAQTVAANLSTSLQDPASPYLRVGRGVYALKAVTERPHETRDNIQVADQVEETGALRAFGMFWQRDSVLWSGAPKLLGRQGAGATDVNFADQVGVYLLHDRDRVIYVGRAADTLFARLKAHTTDRLGGRWDRFSWFGLRAVENDGALADSRVPWSQDVVIETMEALLIESLEPPLNRRRGDNLSGIEFTQTPDPQIELNRRKAFLDDLVKRAGM